MHPVMSELGLYVAEHEARVRWETARREWLVREATDRGREPGLVTRFVHAVRQFADPRGYAMAQVRQDPIASAPDALPPATVAPVTRLVAPEGATSACEAGQAA